jgi:surface protein
MMKKITFLLTFVPLFIFAQNPFITTWQTDADGSGSSVITIPTNPNYTYNYDVDWENDGVYDDIGVTGDITRDYGTAGTYTVAITGVFPQILIGALSFPETLKIRTVEQWGDIQWVSMNQAFSGAQVLSVNANDSPDLSNVTDMSRMFVSATAFNQNINQWDVSNVTNMEYMFQGANSFNQDISNWDVSNVTNMQYMFQNSAFNQDLNNWNVGNVTNMNRMFQATPFNQDLNNWDVSSVTDMGAMFPPVFNGNISSWDVSNVIIMEDLFAGSSSFNQDISNWNVSSVTNMQGMFRQTVLFNQNLNSWDVSNVVNMFGVFSLAQSFNGNVSGWDVSNVTEMGGMFFQATSFNQDISSWNVGNVTNMVDMFNGVTLSTDNYNALLEGWSQQALQPNVAFSGGNSQYCTSAKQDIIDNFGWTITDGGLTSNCAQSYPAYNALVSLYNATDGPNWTNNANWLSNEPLDTWHGVSLNADRSLNTLNLSANSLNGSLVTELGELTQMETLNLSENELSGNIPDVFLNITNLNTLILNNNELTGVLPDLSQTALYSSVDGILAIENNDFIFSDLEPQINNLILNVNTLTYAPMNPFTEPETIPIVVGQNITLDAAFNNGTSGRSANAALNVYQWYKDDVLINGATDSSYTIVSATNTDAGTYICNVTNTDVPGLTLETSPYIVEPSLGIDDADRQSFKLYPNPTKDKLTIASNNNTPIDTVEFYDILGKRVLTISRNFESIDVSKLALGTYFVKIKAGSSSVSKKLVVN